MLIFVYCEQLLNLALTRKTKKAQHELSEMCGFPIKSVDTFVEKLVKTFVFSEEILSVY